jgi:hypothetical protein
VGKGLRSSAGNEEREKMMMEDKCANMAKECLGCAHCTQEYHEYPCSECEHNGGEYKMYFPAVEMNAILAREDKPKIKDSGERRVFQTGAVRDCAEGKGRCDLLPLAEVAGWMNDPVLECVSEFIKTHDPVYLDGALCHLAVTYFSCKADLVLEMAIHMEEGLKKYPERNWENGISIHSFVDSGVRHYLKVLRGDDDENRLRACVWNLMCCIWTMHNKPEIDDLPKVEETNEE